MWRRRTWRSGFAVWECKTCLIPSLSAKSLAVSTSHGITICILRVDGALIMDAKSAGVLVGSERMPSRIRKANCQPLQVQGTATRDVQQAMPSRPGKDWHPRRGVLDNRQEFVDFLHNEMTLYKLQKELNKQLISSEADPLSPSPFFGNNESEMLCERKRKAQRKGYKNNPLENKATILVS